ncbi:heterokaryon incompatibility, partial [Hyaloscypha hepaticicola]
DENDYIKEYDSLSYVWGSEANAEVMVCNSLKFPISQTLFEAFRMLRKSQKQVRYLWIDALCVNQSDNEEKSNQVWNMLEIYKKATRVIAWIGASLSDMDNVLVA